MTYFLNESAPATVLSSTLHPFLEILQRDGFVIGPHTYIQVERLVRNLATSRTWLITPEPVEHSGTTLPPNLGPLLAPIICKSAEQQERFHILFQHWERERLQTEEIDSDPDRKRDFAQQALTVNAQASRQFAQTAQRLTAR